MVSFSLRAGEATEEQNVIHIILTSKGGGFISVAVWMPTRSMVHETASFYWHGIQSVPLGYMSLALQRGQLIIVRHAPASILQPHPFNAGPPPPQCHSCINTISPVKNAGMLAIIHNCLWLIMQSDCPLTFFEFKRSWPRASRPSPILPIFSSQSKFILAILGLATSTPC